MKATDIPDAVSYTIGVEESERIRARMERDSARLPVFPMVAAQVLLVGAQCLLTVRRYGWHEPLVAVQVASVATFVVFAVCLVWYRRTHVPATVRPHVVTRVTFDDANVTIAREDGRAPRTVRVTSVRTVSTTPEAFLITTRWSPILVIPKRVFPDGGAAFTRFFENRLIGRRLLALGTARTSIVNTVAR